MVVEKFVFIYIDVFTGTDKQIYAEKDLFYNNKLQYCIGIYKTDINLKLSEKIGVSK